MRFPIAPFGRILDGLVHPSVVGDRLVVLRHRSFIASHLLVGLAALCLLPIWLVVTGSLSLVGATVFAWLAAPLAVAAFLSRTGRMEAAYLVSAVAFSGLIVWAGAHTGGLASPALAWFAVVPLEAALSGSRRSALVGTGIAVAGALALFALGQVGALPNSGSVTMFGAALLVAAILYAGGVAIRALALFRQSLAMAGTGGERYRLLADHVTDMITCHKVNGDVAFASPATRVLLGVSASDVLGDGLLKRVHIGDRPAYLTALCDARATRSLVTVEFRLRSDVETDARSRGFIDVEMSCRPSAENGEAADAIVAVTRDITRRKAQEATMRAAQEEAERANLAKSHFLARMSHELRTPLNAIIGFSEVLETEAVGALTAERQRDYARLIRVSGEHLLQVVNGILDMSKIESGAFEIMAEPMAIAPLARTCIEMMSGQAAERHVKVNCRVTEDLPTLVADPRAVRQILINLLSNAIKFSEDGGKVTVETRTDGEEMVLSVADNGIGISADDLPLLGTPFIQADGAYDRRYQGTGLGLSIVKGLAELHGGRLMMESRVGEGTTVSVRFPLDAGSPHGAAAQAESNDRRVSAVGRKEVKYA